MNRKLLALLWAVIVATGVARPAAAGTEPATYVLSPNGHTLMDAVVDPGLGRIFALEVRESPRLERLIAFDLETRTVVGDLPLSDGYLNDRPRLAIDRATHTIYVLQVVADRTSRVTVIDGDTLTVTATAAGPDVRFIRAGFDLPSHTVYASPQTGDMGLHEISLEPATLGQSRHFIPLPARLNEIVVHHGTRRIYAVGLTGGVFAIDGQTRQVVASSPLTGRSIDVDQNTRLLYLTTDAGILTLDPDTLGTIATIAVPQMTSNAPTPSRVAVNATLGRAYVGLFSELRMLVVDGANAAIEHAVAVSSGSGYGGALVPDETNGHVYVVQGTRLTVVDDVYAPGSLKVSATPGNKQVRLDWYWTTDGGSTIAAYEVLVDGAVVATVGADTTSYLLTGLLNGARQHFEVRPVNAVAPGPAAGQLRAAGEPHAVAVGAGPSGIAVDVAANVIYTANSESDTVSVVEGVTWTVIGTIPVGDAPTAIAIDSFTRRVFVANRLDNTVSVIDGGTRAVIATVPVGGFPWGIAVDPGTHAVYVANTESDTVTVIDGGTNTILHTIPVGDAPIAVAVNPVTHEAFVANANSTSVSVIGASFAVTNTIPVERDDLPAHAPLAIAVDPLTQMVFAAGFMLRQPGAAPAVFTIDATTKSPGPLLSAPFNRGEWTLEAMALNSATGWAYTVWNYSTKAPGGETVPSNEYFDNRFDARGLTFAGKDNSAAIAETFTRKLQSVAVDDVRNIVYVTGTRPDGQGILISYAGLRLNQAVGISGPTTGPIAGLAPLVTTGGPSGNPVVLSVDPSSDPNVCSIGSGSVVSLSAEGTCVIRATQQGDDNFNAGIATHAIEVGLAAQTISFDGPGAGMVAGSATLEAIGGGSLNPVVFAVDASTAPGVCALSGNVVSYTAAGTCIVVATQAGNAEYLPADPVTRSIVVVPAGAVISWPNPAPIVYGTALDDSQLNASANVPGTFAYSPAAGTVLDGGSHILTVTFTPHDSVNYIAGIASVTIDVAQATALIAWPRPEAISYGTPLGAEQLNATADLPGTFVYSPAAGDVLEVGLQTLSVTFTPDDATNYAPTTAVTFVNVDPARPAIAWPQPAPIVYGTPLGDAQLNAVADAPGTLTYQQPAGTVLPAGTHTLAVKFTPADPQHYGPSSATVTVTVTRATPAITWPQPAAIGYGTALGALELNATASVPGTFTYTPALGTVLDAGSHALSVTFTPDDAANYEGATTSATIEVTRIGVRIVWPRPEAISYGTPLGAEQLNATADLPGTFVYSPAAGDVLEVGLQTLSVTFTPDDATNYAPTTAVTFVNVDPARPAITWPQPAPIVYGTPLGDAQLNAVADAPGTLTYQQPAGTVLPAGTHTLAVKFTPADPQHYGPSSATVTVTVTRATPAITWPQPAAIGYGTALGASQLNASANVPGTFAYAPAAGTVLAVGNHVLTVTFTPEDAANHEAATASVTIDVIAPPTATITWEAPAPIAYGTALGGAQLNATASMPGTFTYQPEAGTVLAPGTHVLQAVFTPAAGAPITATTSLVVLSQRDILLDRLAAMRALRGSAGNFGKRMQLEAAIFALAGAVSPRLWERDGITLDDRQGSRVFILTRLSAKISAQAARGRRSGIDEGALETIHRTLAEVDRQLAVTALDAAGRRAKPDAKRELRAGDEDFADGRYLAAMDHYGDAWEDADAKRGRHNRHDDHDHDRDCRHGKRRGR